MRHLSQRSTPRPHILYQLQLYTIFLLRIGIYGHLLVHCGHAGGSPRLTHHGCQSSLIRVSHGWLQALVFRNHCPEKPTPSPEHMMARAIGHCTARCVDHGPVGWLKNSLQIEESHEDNFQIRVSCSGAVMIQVRLEIVNVSRFNSYYRKKSWQSGMCEACT
jgi:hypothetical protein